MERIRTNSREVTGVVLGGGKGTRLHPLTAETSKHLLPIGDKPMISRVIGQLSVAGIKDVLLLIDQRYASQYMDTLRDGADLGLRSLGYIWQDPEGQGLPTAIGKVAPHTGDGKIVVACGDVLIENGIKKPVDDFMKQRIGARIVGAHVQDSAGYSPLQTAGEQVTDILPKDSQRHQEDVIDIGTYMYHPDVFNRIPALTPSPRGETEIWELNKSYIPDGALEHSVIDGWWSDTGGSIAAYEEAHARYS